MPLIEELPVINPIKASHGWAYVTDTGPIAAQQPGTRDRKRAAASTARNGATTTAKREKAIQTRLDSLNKENAREVTIAVPARKSNGKKVTPNVRRILAYQRNFAHYLAEEEAAHPNATHYTLPPLASGMAPPATPATLQRAASGKKGRGQNIAEPVTPVPTSQRGTKRGRQSSRSQSISQVVDATPNAEKETEIKTEASTTADTDTTMSDAPPAPAAHEHPSEWDSDPLLASPAESVPPMPSDRVMQLLISEPPLTYNAARAKPLDEETRPPARKFCGVCGYWGRVKCRKCEEYTCGIMECWKDHERICVNANLY